MNPLKKIAAAAFVASLVLAGCSSGDSGDTAAKTPPPANDAQLTKGTETPQKASTD